MNPQRPDAVDTGVQRDMSQQTSVNSRRTNASSELSQEGFRQALPNTTRPAGNRYNYNSGLPPARSYNPDRAYSQDQRRLPEVRRNPPVANGVMNVAASGPSPADYGLMKNQLEQFAITQPFAFPFTTVPPGYFPQFVMAPTGEPVLPLGNLPVASFPSSHGSPDGSENGSFVNGNPSVSPTSRDGEESEAVLELRNKLINQIQFYFSTLNLSKDKFLLSKMDSERFVDVALIAGFPRILAQTNDVEQVRQAMRHCPALELDPTGQKVRARHARVLIQLSNFPEATESDARNLFTDRPELQPVDTPLDPSRSIRCIEQDLSRAPATLEYLSSKRLENGEPLIVKIKTPDSDGPAPPYVAKAVENGFQAPPASDEQTPATRPVDLAPAFPYAPYSAYPNPTNSVFPMPTMGPYGFFGPTVPGVTFYDAAFNPLINPMLMSAPYFGAQNQPPMQRGPIQNGRGRGRGGRGMNGYNNGPNRRGRGSSHPNSGRNSAMSETRSESNYAPTSNHQTGSSRHGSFSSVNGTQEVVSPTSTRSESNTPPVSGEFKEQDVSAERRSVNQSPRKSSRPVETQAHELETPVQNAVKEPVPNFDLSSSLFPPLPQQLPSESAAANGGLLSPTSLTPSSGSISAADVVRGIASPKVLSPSKGYVNGETDLEPRTLTSSRVAHQATHHENVPSRREQASGTDDLPKHSRDGTSDRTRSSSSGTQTSQSGPEPRKKDRNASDEVASSLPQDPKNAPSDAVGKNEPFSYARIAQLNRDKVAPSGSSGGQSSARGSFTRQISNDGSAQSQEDKRFGGSHQEPSSSGRSRATYREQRTQTRQSDHVNGINGEVVANGHRDAENREQTSENDDDGFTEVVKHRSTRHENRAARNGSFRAHNGAQS